MATTWAGIATAVGTIATAIGKALGDGFQFDDIAIIVTTSVAAIGLLFAADGNKPGPRVPYQP